MSRLFMADLQFSGVECSVRIACCLLLDVVAGVVFGCRRIVESVGGNVQRSHHCAVVLLDAVKVCVQRRVLVP